MKQVKTQTKLQSSKTSVAVFWTMSVATALFICFSFFYWTVVPYMQSSEYLGNIRQAFSTGNMDILTSDQFVFEPDSNVQGILRSDFLREVLSVYNQGHIDKQSPLLDKAISEMEEYLSNHPDYYTYILALANGYAAKSEIQNDPNSFAIAEKYYKKDMDVVKGRQDIVYTYAMNLIKHKRADEGISLIKVLAEKNPDIYTSNYQLGEAYIISGDTHYNDSLSQFEIALSHGVDMNNGFTKSAYQEFLKYYYKNKDIEHFSVVVNRLILLDPNQKYSYMGVLEYIQKNNKIPDLQLEPKK